MSRSSSEINPLLVILAFIFLLPVIIAFTVPAMIWSSVFCLVFAILFIPTYILLAYPQEQVNAAIEAGEVVDPDSIGFPANLWVNPEGFDVEAYTNINSNLRPSWEYNFEPGSIQYSLEHMSQTSGLYTPFISPAEAFDPFMVAVGWSVTVSAIIAALVATFTLVMITREILKSRKRKRLAKQAQMQAISYPSYPTCPQ